MDRTEAISEEKLDQAYAWVACLRSDQLSASDRAAFSTWIQACDENRAAFDAAVEMWADLGALSALPLDELFPESVPTTRAASGTATPRKPARSWSPMAWMGGGLAAACLAVVAWLNLPAEKQDMQRYATAVGETRVVTLVDGSSVHLNTNTELEVSYSRGARETRLTRGEAFFSVTHLTGRPFTVEAGNAEVRVLGTEFNVEFGREATRVAVTQGTVAVSETGADDTLMADSVKLTKNQKVSVGKAGISAVKATSEEQVLDWTRGILVFDSTPLAEVLSELNRYLSKPASASPDAQQLAVSGTFKLSNPEGTLAAIATALNLQTDDSDPNLTHLSVPTK
ncbi:FecR family protein [Biformimicrobium ophioploci]|uniref:FecR family protein n=1 Tax=Biformimicrobium ophioploci TaxID=3036711 RepID=A0ABQ6LYY4_9GAMM|nr:FecR domain-containing protein [Microbulbifer sp. NKW57]GMG87278.1 FecR family protein [Microbulbifer sp. NKW57]